MKLTDLKPAPGSKKSKKRVGRGHGCHGKTSGRGSKGQNARSGGGKPPGFEGGQTPWYRRLPKFKGFKNKYKIRYTEVNVDALSKFDKDSTVSPEDLVNRGIIKNLNMPVKVLGGGKIEIPLTVKMHKFTKSAKEMIEKAGGKVEVI
ncbi:MAG: 50S ribosomal protein L15 [Armatimonadota bacterium]